MKRQASAVIGLMAIVGFLIGLVASGALPAGPRNPLAMRSAAADARPLTVSVGEMAPAPATGSGGGSDFAAVAARLNGAVVNVDAASRGAGDRALVSRMWPGEGANAPHEGSGSGFIIDASGFILTNNHVVDGADRVTVTLGDGRVFRASVVGLDPAIDIALLQITASGPLPVAPLGDSDTLRVGEWVCAIGNPLGYVHSVTVGVVSFLGRKIFDPGLDAFIQTDAGISFGNSGGPLINARGQVVGITTAISSQVANIGFAIPIAQVVAALPQLKARGRVARGDIGAALTDVTPDLQHALRLAPSRGAMVQDVSPDTPAEQAGLRPYDVVVAADGAPILSEEALARLIFSREPGTVVQLDVWRDGVTRAVSVRLKERVLAQVARVPGPPDAARRAAGPDFGPLGLLVKDLDEDTARRTGLPEAIAGVAVINVDLAGPARLAGIQSGQILLEINRTRVTSAGAYQSLVAGFKSGDAVAVLVYDPRLNQRSIRSIHIDPQP